MKRYLELASGRRPGVPASNNRVMVISPDSVFYFGLIGETTPRSLGSLTIYLSLDEPFGFRADGGHWEDRQVAVVAPYIEHQIVARDRVGILLVEPENFDSESVSGLACEGVGSSDFAVVIDSLMDLMHQLGGRLDEVSIADYLETTLGDQFQRRNLDARIGTIVGMIREQPWERFSAESCAAISGISVSRFLHLFKSEIGVTFRRFIAWKRARCALEYVKHRASLTDIALELGYPDSSHFSHSIRRTYGFSPRTMFCASRRLSLCLESKEWGLGMAGAGARGVCRGEVQACA